MAAVVSMEADEAKPLMPLAVVGLFPTDEVLQMPPLEHGGVLEEDSVEVDAVAMVEAEVETRQVEDE
jgi:hypothetical protein